MTAMISSTPRPSRTHPVWSRTQVRILISLAVLFVGQVTAAALYVLGG